MTLCLMLFVIQSAGMGIRNGASEESPEKRVCTSNSSLSIQEKSFNKCILLFL